MSDTKWTPGPWYVDSAPWMGLAFGVLCDGKVVAGCKEITEDADKHNAHLIAAAPVLYRELKDVLRTCRKDFPKGEIGEREFRDAYAEPLEALAKARGDVA